MASLPCRHYCNRTLPLHLACRYSSCANDDVMRRLIEGYPSATSQKDENGDTPLHLACRNESHPPSFATLALLATTSSCGDDHDDEERKGVDDGDEEEVESDDDGGKTRRRRRGGAAGTAASSAVILNSRNRGGEYPVSLSYLVKRAAAAPTTTTPTTTSVSSHHHHPSSPPSSQNNNNSPHLLLCLTHLLDAKLELCYLPAFTSAVQFIADLEDAPTWFCDPAVVHPYTQAILNWRITRPFTVLVLMLDSYVAVMIIVCYRVVGWEANNGRSWRRWGCERGEVCGWEEGEGETTGVGGVAVGLIYVGATYMALREVLQASGMMHRGELLSWFIDFWNWVDMGLIGSLFVSTTYMYNGSGDDQTLRLLTVFTTGFMWVEALSILKTINHNFAVFVSGLIHMVLNLRHFLCTICLILVAFAQMYLSQYQATDICPTSQLQPKPSSSSFPSNNDDDNNNNNNNNNNNTSSSSSFIQNNFCTMTNSYLKVYTMLVGDGVDESQFTNGATSLTLSVIFSFIILILLLNILIAIVTDSYGEVVKRSENVFWRQRLSFVFEVDQSYIFSKLLFKKFMSFVGRGGNGDDDHDDDNDDHDSDDNIIMNEFGESSNAQKLTNGLSLLWSIALTTFDDPSSLNTWKQRCKLKMEWREHSPSSSYSSLLSSWLIGPVVNPMEQPQDVAPSWWRRIVFAIFLPLWVLLGFLSVGILWPPQIKRWLFCPAIKDRTDDANNNDNKSSSSSAITTEMGIIFDGIERQMKSDWDSINLRVDRTCAGMLAIEGYLNRTDDNVSDLHDDMVKLRKDVKGLKRKMVDMTEGVGKIQSLLESL